ncbi:MAG: LLM class flavin-dependent oxidoreductase [Rhodospirillales bacterium]
MTIQYSILDQSIAVAGEPQGQAIRNTVELASFCEGLGYKRFWVSEHHNHPSILGSAPEVLLAAIAMKTSSIRIGSAGVMLPHYSPYKVAEQFRVLDALAPGRIDLGLGRAPGSDGRTAFALNPNANERPNQFPADVRDLMAWLSGEPLLEGHPFREVRAYPAGDTTPQMWMLGSSDYGAQVAAHFGLPYAFAWFFTDGRGAEQALQMYKQYYRPSALWPEPNAAICVWALAGDDKAEAERNFMPRAKWRLARDRGQFISMQTPDDVLAEGFTEAENIRIQAMLRDGFVGEGADVAERIQALGAELGVQEIAIVTWAHEESIRRRSYELLAEHLGVSEAQGVAA